MFNTHADYPVRAFSGILLNLVTQSLSAIRALSK
jgi:hypothetical protein